MSENKGKITIGIPVYNGAPLIEESLQSLFDDDQKDMKIVIYDNLSDDETEQIAQKYAAKDPRISYVRNAENIGAIGNFRKALEACDTEYFAWRAYDDLSNPQFFTVLKQLLDANRDAVLAVPDIVTVKMAKSKRRARPYKGGTGEPFKLLRNSQAAWIYGLFRTKFLKTAFFHVCDHYPHLRANDHLVLFRAILDGGVVGSNEAHFTQRDTGTGQNSSNVIGFAEKKAVMRDYYEYCSARIDETDWPSGKRLMMRLAVMRHVNRRVQRLRKLFF